MATKLDFNAAFLGPDLVQKQAQLQQNQLLAQQLLQAGGTPQEGQMVSGHYVAPSVGAGLANALKGYYGMQLAKDLPRQNSEIAQAQFGQVANLFGGQQGDAPQAGSMPGQPQAQSQPLLQPLPGLSMQQSATLAGGIGVPEYLKIQAQSLTPTELQKNLIAQGIQPGTPQWNQALQGNLQKQNYIAPVSASPGATLLDPTTNRPVFSAPQNGIQTTFGPDGVAQAMPVAGYGAAQAGIAGQEADAVERARAGYDLTPVVDPVTGDTIQKTRAEVASNGATSAVNPITVEARKALPKIESQATSTIDIIDKVLKHPGLDKSVGVASYLPSIRGSDRANFEALKDQLQGKTFQQAYESLRGGGAITEIETTKAEQAIARMSAAQSPSEFRSAMNEYKSVIETGVARAREMARMPGAKNSNQPANNFANGDYSSLW